MFMQRLQTPVCSFAKERYAASPVESEEYLEASSTESCTLSLTPPEVATRSETCPKVLTVATSGKLPAFEGKYRLTSEVFQNKPVWAKGDMRIHSGSLGHWLISESEEDMRKSMPVLRSATPHNGQPPSQVPTWQVYRSGRWHNKYVVNVMTETATESDDEDWAAHSDGSSAEDFREEGLSTPPPPAPRATHIAPPPMPITPLTSILSPVHEGRKVSFASLEDICFPSPLKLPATTTRVNSFAKDPASDPRCMLGWLKGAKAPSPLLSLTEELPPKGQTEASCSSCTTM